MHVGIETPSKHCTVSLKDYGPVIKPIKVNRISSDHEIECNSHTDLGSVNRVALNKSKPETLQKNPLTKPSLFLRVGKNVINCLIFTFLIFSIFSWEKKWTREHYVVFLLA